ncbi:sodium-extruding oxaloacetate decarboxylase subunit alpha [Natranaerobius trueperi]|uniref:Oxaloacetate decarboxylase subunit alpha n=1 Tax=Natranaerobius trueperi TaxID=759412 RepID=A0A226C038_9FIRM|nr:sodium-extruding oxaloacetate decarboxylase subunit alpha [Natranaerobius trueperi]OWZ84412.1 oxaloacetate decarboxylase subunit alpha [Natranaerobius trueperi]
MSVKITDTTLRDAHQSLFATRMQTKDMEPILETIDQVGFHSLEMWGGATFDSCMRFLDEDPWERLRIIRKKIKNTKLQMLLRGQNILGYKNYPDDVLEEFIKRTVGNGMDIIRIFDALNDIRNMEKAIEFTKKEGGHAQGALSYTISPVHDVSTFVDLAKNLVEIGCDSICIKDMAGLLSPYKGYELVKNLKKEIDVPIQLHSHSTSGMATSTYLKTIEAGIDIVDTTVSPFALGTSQPPIEPILAMLAGTENKLSLDEDNLKETTDYFKKVRKDLEKHSKMNFTVDTNVLNYQVPGGMISNLTSQLSEANALDKYDEALEEIPRVREDLGYPPLVTPTSQIVGSQAVLNVLMGERYKMISEEVKNYIAGYYGRPPHEVNSELEEYILKDKEKITERPANLLDPQLEKAREDIKEYIEKDEDVLSYCLFPNVALDFFKKRKEGKLKDPLETDKKNNKVSTPGPAGDVSRKMRVTVDDETFDVHVEDLSGDKSKTTSHSTTPKKQKPNQNKSQKQQKSQTKEKKGEPETTSQGNTIDAPIAGNVLKVQVDSGDTVNQGDVVVILEAMKMENEIKAEVSGTVKEVKISEGGTVNAGDPLIVL